jgi:serine/threonine-protein kinase HipA
MNPCPVDVRPRVHALAIDDADPAGSLDTALSVAPRFGLSAADAKSIAAEVGTAVAAWRATAKRFKLTAAQTDRMSSAFDHADLAAAVSYTRP